LRHFPMDRQDILFQQTGVAGALLLEKALLYSVARVVHAVLHFT
jgi:hypothetical protein